jgi:predicted aminopeptidase
MKQNAVFFIAPLIAALVLGVCSFLFSACYTLKQGAAMIGYLRRAVPLENLVGSPQSTGPASDETVRFVERVEDIRRFSVEELGLKPTRNYTRYVEIDRDYLAAVVSASEKDSFTPYRWWFPIVGDVPYKGFFNPEDAKKEGADLQKKDLDVWIRPVEAFSTLGWFRDPLYSFMKNYTVNRLADLIIHESFHATVFLSSHTQFNEELAEFIGSEGARLYVEKKYGADSTEAQETIARREEDARFVSFIQSLIAELNPVYNSDSAREEKLAKKAEIIEAARRRFADNYDAMFTSERYRGFIDMEINNAYLELYNLYYERNDRFKELYRASGSDIRKFIAAAKQLNTKSDPMAQLEKALDTAIKD